LPDNFGTFWAFSIVLVKDISDEVELEKIFYINDNKVCNVREVHILKLQNELQAFLENIREF
jgi:hypothetical protein